ncbi:MAG: hypothetical protein JRI39_09215 [Deltaproteobacteria bacterium]|nr:hypothetical protein [Deltaproteobacteria bacterium]MBW2083245.1 hypothetical protein [Deltaproteobacteria bacterium]
MVEKIPQKLLCFFGKFLGNIAYVADARHRRIVKRNLRFAIPSLDSSAKINRTARGVFQNAAISFLEILQMSRLSRNDILQKVQVKGSTYLLDAKNSQRGTIVISAHFGNWEMAHIFGSCFLNEPLVLVARKVKPSIVNEWLNRVRGRFGSEILDKSSALPRMIRAIRRGKILGVLIDQGTLLSDGVEVTFFGKKTNATPAAAVLARRYKAAVLPVFCVRRKDGDLEVVAYPPLDLQESDDYQQDFQVNTQMMINVIESAIREHPDQWFWFHKRWKRHYPELYKEDWRRRKKKKAKRKARIAKALLPK